MYAVQNQEANVIDSLSGSVSQWYADVDAASKGVTANDALKIQEYLLGKTKEL